MSAVAATAARRSRSAVRALRVALRPPPHLRRRLAALIGAAAVLLFGYFLWLRDASFVSVEEVTVTGLTSDDAARVRAALAAAARGMTTLHVDHEELREATAAFPVVRSIEARPDFPSGMRIHVTEHRPVAVLQAGTRRLPVAADGSVLSGLPAGGGLPLVRVEGALPDRRVEPGAALAAVRVAGGLPAPLAARAKEVRRTGDKGVVVVMEDGPRLIFGSATRLGAKWAAAVRVLADRDAAGADYIDVRLPDRPVAGGLRVETLAPAAPADESAKPPVAGGRPAAPAAGEADRALTPAAPGTSPPATSPPPSAPSATAGPGQEAPASPPQP